MFLEGAERERCGQMHEAIRSYTRAIHLVPDIERRVFAPANSKNANGKRPNKVDFCGRRLYMYIV